ncbi:hypothetical protein D024_3808 [Vibrio parahaemolyticus 3259]|nr:hypothetical protein D019_2729 [Vibrio parahaemolyticus VP2007-095]EQM15829.1 hypothetical protein D024_3808 [Vibrio parahaemolyticus 3259]ETJ93962.1 hypothetical protein D041_0782 [Vibrio parahaemolyticus EKP-008]
MAQTSMSIAQENGVVPCDYPEKSTHLSLVKDAQFSTSG